MAELILRDAAGVEMGRRPMEAHERYALYTACRDHDYVEYAGMRFTLRTVAWDRATEQCICGVTFQSYVPVDCGNG